MAVLFVNVITALTSAFLSQLCPYFSEWSVWSGCSEVCGGGVTSRYRNCINGDVGDGGCSGPVREEQNCNNQVTDWNHSVWIASHTSWQRYNNQDGDVNYHPNCLQLVDSSSAIRAAGMHLNCFFRCLICYCLFENNVCLLRFEICWRRTAFRFVASLITIFCSNKLILLNQTMIFRC